MLYGATGYSLGLAAQECKAANLDFIVGGRTESKVKATASLLKAPYRIFSPDDATSVLDKNLTGLTLFVNGAGPFHRTCEQFMDACIRNGVHYIDITAELNSFHAAAVRDQAAKNAGVMLMPSAASGVEVMLDCIGGRVLERAAAPVKLEHTMNINGPVSRGTVGSIRGFSPEVVRRVDGQLVPHSDRKPTDVDFGDGRGPLPRFPSNDPQVITLWKVFGIPNISTYCVKTGGDFPTGELESIPEGPDAEQRRVAPYHAALEVMSRDGSVVGAVVHMMNGYDLTARGTLEAAKAILSGEVEVKPGFQTPFAVFGGSYVDRFPSTAIEEF